MTSKPVHTSVLVLHHGEGEDAGEVEGDLGEEALVALARTLRFYGTRKVKATHEKIDFRIKSTLDERV